MMYPTMVALIGLVLVGCSGTDGHERPNGPASDQAASLFVTLDSTRTGITFNNELVETDEWNIIRFEYLFNGAGVGVGDFNNDGLQDLYFVSNTGSDRLYLNEGEFRFRDISQAAGIADARGFKTGVTLADVNGDGLLDIYVCRDAYHDPEVRRNLLYINNGDLTFTEQGRKYGLDDPSHSTQAYFFDMDLDGDLDMYLVNHPASMVEANNLRVKEDASGKLVRIQSEDLTYATDRIYRNDKDRFTDITTRAGVTNEAFGLSAAIGHFNDDLLPDIYVCNDYVMPDQLWINQGNGTFKDKFAEQFQNCSFSSMGSDLADINNDGFPDLLTLDMTPGDPYRYKTLAMTTNFDKYNKLLYIGFPAQYSANAMQLNNGNGKFSNIAFLSGMAYTDWSWSALLADLDNDGWKDAYITNGYYRDITNNDYLRYKMDSLQKELNAGRLTLLQWTTSIPSVRVRSFLFRNEGDLSFSDRSADWNAGPAAFSNGAAYADLDNDGHLDIVVNNLNDVATVLRNTGADRGPNGFLRFALDAGKGRTAFGSRVELVMDDGSEQVQWIQPGRGFLSCSEPIAHFGLGRRSAVQHVKIIWPDGTEQGIDRPAINELHSVKRAEGSPKHVPAPKPAPLFVDRSRSLPKEMAHTENAYIDFKREPLLHQMLSQEGPAVAVGDVNGDGLDDVYLGGAMDASGTLFLQSSNGTFRPAGQNTFMADRSAEDVAALFFDADGDGDLDLYVGSGGNERHASDPAYADRLYLNDGSGNFSRAVGALPAAYNSTSCVQAIDIDGDGDLDLFIGARVSPGRYPEPPANQLLRNDGGRFTDVTTIWSEGLQHIGMVTDARFADLDRDGAQELVLVGEWMPITVFRWKNGKYTNVTASFGLNETQGWWCSLAIADLNKDGYPEILAGNVGLNSAMRTSKAEPTTMLYKDFDGNGTIDPVLCTYTNGRSYPVHMRDRLLDQMIMLKKRFLRFHDHAIASIDEVFTAEERNGARTLVANTFAHTLFLNQGGSSFVGQALPLVAQTSMARGLKFMDVDQDGHMDVIVAGNDHGTDAQFGRYDACIGLFLQGNGTTTLTARPPAGTGLMVGGNVRKLIPLTVGGERCLLVVRNSDRCSLIGLPKRSALASNTP